MERRKDPGMAFLGAASAALWVLCWIHCLQITGSNAEALVTPEEIKSFPSFHMNVEARSNLERWLEYVHGTSDPDEELWADEVGNTLVSTEGKTTKRHHDKENHHHHFKPKLTIVVAKDGSGHFRSIQAAINHVPKENKERVLIRIKAGVYRYFIELLES